MSKRVYSLTGRQLTINGSLHWSFFPYMGVSISDATLSNPKDFPKTPFIEIKQAKVRVGLAPLFLGRIELNQIDLERPVIHLIRKSDTSNNWQLFKSAPIQTQASSSTDESLLHFKTNISQISVSNALVTYQGGTSNLSLDQVNLNLHDIAFGKAFPLTLQFNLKNQNPSLSGPVKINSKIILNPTSQTYELHRALMVGNLVDPSNPARKIDAQIKLNLSVDLKQQTLAINNVRGQLNNMSFNGNVLGQAVRGSKRWTGHFVVTPFNPRALENSLGFELPNTKTPFVFTKAQADLQFTSDEKGMTINPLAVTVDNTHLTGQIGVLKSPEMPAIKFSLAIDQLDLDSYLPMLTSIKMQPKSVPAVQPSTGDNQSLPCTVDGDLKIGTFRIRHMMMQSLSAHIGSSSATNTINIAPISAQVYQGQLKGSLSVVQPSGASTYLAQATLNRIQLQPLFHDLFGNDLVSGLGDMTVKLNTKGTTPYERLKNLQGNGSVSMDQVAIKQFNLQYQLALIDSLIHIVPQTSQQNSTTMISHMGGNFTIKNGVVHNNNFSLKSPLILIKGQGDINLVDQQWLYHLRATVLVGSDARLINLEQMLGGSIPFLAKGSFDHFQILPDPLEMGRGALAGPLKEIKKEGRVNLNRTFNQLQRVIALPQ